MSSSHILWHHLAGRRRSTLFHLLSGILSGKWSSSNSGIILSHSCCFFLTLICWCCCYSALLWGVLLKLALLHM